jgi:hypothetical protein
VSTDDPKPPGEPPDKPPDPPPLTKLEDIAGEEPAPAAASEPAPATSPVRPDSFPVRPDSFPVRPDSFPVRPDSVPVGPEQWSLSPRAKLIAIGGGVFAVFLAVMIVLSYLNSRDYFLVCGAEKVTAERGSKFPWGQTRLGGDELAPIKVTPDSACTAATFATLGELREAFAQVLINEASRRITTKIPEDIDEAERQLEQAMLLARTIPSKRAAIESLRGDVEYWRAASELERVVGELEQAAAKFKSAAEMKPRHSTDAPQWSEFASSVAQDLHRGPPELRNDRDYGPDTPMPFQGTDTSPAPPRDGTPTTAIPADPDRPPAPLGTALPPIVDAGPSAPPSAGAPDAGIPTGGVLL